MKMTTKQFAEYLGVDYPTAKGTLNLLEKLGAVKEVGTLRTAAKGKPSTVYGIPADVVLRFPTKDFEIFQLPEENAEQGTLFADAA